MEKIYNKKGEDITKEYNELLNNKTLAFGKYVNSSNNNYLREMIKWNIAFDNFCQEQFNN
ncbi:hypothetical protein [Clostridium sp.]|uniref:hypothetical protein n=1 Tax=Clostridium sp. TaxID=1506 RepID=UPI001D21B68B|nr:hypothetical protein [Clostridium sp.]MBS5307725.1 hypothetical protein [Clostridium sp.]